MAFESLSEKLETTFRKLKGKGRLTEMDINEAMRDVRLALLEADVNFKLVKDFVNRISEKSKNKEVLESLSPAQMVIKIVNDELTALMGSENKKLNLSSKSPSVVMMVGLQGAGKTTNAAKLALNQKKLGKRPLLVACDVYRPAAIDQLIKLGKDTDVPVFEQGKGNPVQIAEAGIAHAKKFGNDLVIIDTAGRLHIDEELMQELISIKEAVKPSEIMLVVDAMTGQDAVNVAQSFDEKLDITGLLLSKLDGDARGGAALSVTAMTGKPIKFTGTGEKMDKLEPFYPDRMASRILGMGDVLSLIEKAEKSFDEKKATELAEKLKKNKFTLADYYDQLVQIKSMGSLEDIAAMIPGMSGLKGVKPDEDIMKKTEAMILSMTPKERENPNILGSSRKKRIAAGSGTNVSELNRLLKQYEMMNKMVKSMTAGGKKRKKLGKMGGFPSISGFPGF
ncbi:MAG: signal recognition particle protein [Clostridiales bacterium]|nr:signal recognition particle protein [Clostridiales bacterium]